MSLQIFTRIILKVLYVVKINKFSTQILKHTFKFYLPK